MTHTRAPNDTRVRARARVCVIGRARSRIYAMCDSHWWAKLTTVHHTCWLRFSENTVDNRVKYLQWSSESDASVWWGAVPLVVAYPYSLIMWSCECTSIGLALQVWAHIKISMCILPIFNLLMQLWLVPKPRYLLHAKLRFFIKCL